MFDYPLDTAAIITELNVSDFNEAEQAGLINRISQLLQERVAIQIETIMSDADVATFVAFLDVGNTGDAQQFVLQKVPNLSDIYATELGAIVADLKTSLA